MMHGNTKLKSVTVLVMEYTFQYLWASSRYVSLLSVTKTPHQLLKLLKVAQGTTANTTTPHLAVACS